MKRILAARAKWRVVVLSQKEQGHKSARGAPDSPPAMGRARRMLYWWPPPVGPDQSAEVGRKMVMGIVWWLVFLVVLSTAIAILAA